MEREFSAGGVVLRRMNGRWHVAVIEPQSSEAARAAQRRRTLALPKGLIDPGERADQTALREVREETGLDAVLIAKLSDIRYMYVRSWGDRQRVFKVVSFYLLLYRAGRIGHITEDMRQEVHAAEWLPLDEAPKQLSYHGEREVVSAAQKYVEAHPGLAELQPVTLDRPKEAPEPET